MFTEPQLFSNRPQNSREHPEHLKHPEHLSYPHHFEMCLPVGAGHVS